MIYFIFIFGITIIGTLVFIASLRMPDYISTYSPLPHIIETFNLVELQDSVTYSSLPEMRAYEANRPFDYFSTELIIRDNHHKQNVIQDRVGKMVKDMIKAEMVEIEEFYDPKIHPYRKRIIIKIKAYKKNTATARIEMKSSLEKFFEQEQQYGPLF